MFGLNPDKITKDTLYASAHALCGVHKSMEDFLHRCVCSMFDIDERILLFDSGAKTAKERRPEKDPPSKSGG